MTVDSSMSSGYCSLDEELEDCFFTAKTTFFRNLQSKQPSKVNLMITSTFRGGNMLCGLSGKLWHPPSPKQGHVLAKWLGAGEWGGLQCSDKPLDVSEWLSRSWGPH